MKLKKSILIICFVIFLFGILIYGIGSQKKIGIKSQDAFKENRETEEELIRELEILENFEILSNYDFFKDIIEENE